MTKIDVFSYLEEIVIKKDLDDSDWFYSGYSKKEQKEIEKQLDADPDSEMDMEIMRSNCYMENLSRSLHNDLVNWVRTGENITRPKASKEVNGFIADLAKACKKEKKKKG